MRFIYHLILSLALVSCGYSMRGNINLPDDIRMISLTSEFYSPLLISITDNLKNSDINVTDSKNKNLYSLIGKNALKNPKRFDKLVGAEVAC